MELSYFPLSPGRPFLGSSGDWGGLLYFRQSFQSVDGLELRADAPPPLFGVLLKRWEMPWARVFPLRLKLRLGAEYRYYPAPLWSTRNRRPVYGEIGNTVMKLLCVSFYIKFQTFA